VLAVLDVAVPAASAVGVMPSATEEAVPSQSGGVDIRLADAVVLVVTDVAATAAVAICVKPTTASQVVVTNQGQAAVGTLLALAAACTYALPST